MKNLSRLLCAVVIGATVVALGNGRAWADTTNYWMDPGTGYSGNYTNPAQWTGIVPSTTADWTWFSNRQSSAYTVKFTASATNGPVFIYDDKVTFDLNGYNWRAANAGYIGSNSSFGTTVRFSSSAAPQVTGGNVVRLGTGYANNQTFGNASTTILVDDSLGQPVQFVWAGGAPGAGPYFGSKFVVSGNGSEMVWDNDYYLLGTYGYNVLVTNQARFTVQNMIGGSIGFGAYGYGYPTTVAVINASMKTATSGTTIGSAYGGDTTMVLSNNSTWTESATYTQVGSGWYPGPDGYSGRILMDQSTFNGQGMVLGEFYAVTNGAGLVRVLNNSSMTLSNGYLLITSLKYGSSSNTFLLKSSTLNLGRTGVNGAITNRGLFQAQGTITGQGAGNFLLRNEAELHVGGSPGVLTLNKGNVELAANSKNYFEFSDTALSQINAPNGYASLLGSNIFSLAAGAPAPTNGVKYGLGLYNFVIGTNIVSTPQYDNLVNLLTNNYHLTYGVDFHYGLVDLGGGLFALQLAFVPEPSTVMLLALGGLMLWRRIAKGGRKTGQAVRALTAGAVVLAMVSNSALATTNYWTNAAGGNYTNDANWSLSHTPTASETPYFANNAASPYTVQFSSSRTNGALFVYDDNVVFDLNGYNWMINNSDANTLAAIGSNSTQATTVRFSSSATAQVTAGNAVQFGTGLWDYQYFNGASTTILVDDSLGQPVKMAYVGGAPGAGPGNSVNMVVSGNGSALLWDSVYSQGYYGFSLLVTNHGSFEVSSPWSFGLGTYSYGVPSTVAVINASMRTPTGATIGGPYGGNATVILSNNSTWSDSGAVTAVGDGIYFGNGPDGYTGRLLIDQSTFSGQSMVVGGLTYSNGYADTVGWVKLLNGSSMTLSNGYLFIKGRDDGPTNNFVVMKASNLHLGQPGSNGAITNRGWFTAQGTITGHGAGNFLLRNESELHVGGSPGVLTLNKGNVELAAGSKNYFEFSDTALSQINAHNGYASLLGTNLFSLAAGAPAPVPGVKYGLGIYDFVIGTNVNNSPQYDNLVNLLTNNYHLTYGVDFHYGVVNLGGGLFALELAFVPEPSTLMLLALGGLLVWRRMAKGRAKKNNAFGALIALALLLALAGGSASAAVSTSYWQSVAGDYNGDFSTAGHWNTAAPAATDPVWFTNRQSSAYTVTFSSSVSSGPLNAYDDSVLFNLSGYTWSNNYSANPSYAYIGSNSTYATNIRFSSSTNAQVSGGNTVLFNFPSYYGYNLSYVWGTNTTVTVDNSLGHPVKLVVFGNSPGYGLYNGARYVVSGPGSELQWDYDNVPITTGQIIVTNGGLFTVSGYTPSFGQYNGGAGFTVTVINASMKTTAGGANIGGPYGGNAMVTLSNNSTWTESGAMTSVGDGLSFWGPADGYTGKLLIDHSTLNGQAMVVGGLTYADSYPDTAGWVKLLNGSSMSLSNGYLFVKGIGDGPKTNLFIMNTSSLYLGQSGINGVITNRGLFQAQGTITGHGAGNFLLRNEAELHVGGSPGVLTLNKGNVELAAGSKNYFEFSDTALSQINAQNGYASLLGSNIFSLAAGAPSPVPGVKYGLGIYNFVIGTNVTYAPQYDNLVNLLTNTYHLTYGVDFQYGVVNLGGGLFALELAFVPEPSTVMLFALGGLLVWRRMAKRPVASRK